MISSLASMEVWKGQSNQGEGCQTWLPHFHTWGMKRHGDRS
jgi:hypothetical protein